MINMLIFHLNIPTTTSYLLLFIMHQCEIVLLGFLKNFADLLALAKLLLLKITPHVENLRLT